MQVLLQRLLEMSVIVKHTKMLQDITLKIFMLQKVIVIVNHPLLDVGGTLQTQEMVMRMKIIAIVMSIVRHMFLVLQVHQVM